MSEWAGGPAATDNAGSTIWQGRPKGGQGRETNGQSSQKPACLWEFSTLPLPVRCRRPCYTVRASYRETKTVNQAADRLKQHLGKRAYGKRERNSLGAQCSSKQNHSFHPPSHARHTNPPALRQVKFAHGLLLSEKSCNPASHDPPPFSAPRGVTHARGLLWSEHAGGRGDNVFSSNSMARSRVQIHQDISPHESEYQPRDVHTPAITQKKGVLDKRDFSLNRGPDHPTSLRIGSIPRLRKVQVQQAWCEQRAKIPTSDRNLDSIGHAEGSHYST